MLPQPELTGKVGREKSKLRLSLGCEVVTGGDRRGLLRCQFGYLGAGYLGKLFVKIHRAGHICGLCWVYVTSVKSFKNDSATKFHYTCLSSDYFLCIRSEPHNSYMIKKMRLS